MKKETINQLQIRIEQEKIRQVRERMERIIYAKQEAQSSHHTFEWVEDVLNYICSGDTENVRIRLEDGIRLTGDPGSFSEDAVTNMRYLSISMIACVTFALIERKLMDSETAYSLSDAAISMIDQETDVQEMLNWQCAALMIYAEYAGGIQTRNYHSLIKQAKRYIYENLHTNIKVRDISQHLSCNESYLSRVFRESEGITIQRYIQKKKIEQSCSLLKYSSMTISEISAVFQFSSHSHYGRAFKAIKGMSPKEYRNQFTDTLSSAKLK